MRWEADGLGKQAVPRDAYYGIHTLRALENFDVSGYRLPRSFIAAFAAFYALCRNSQTK